MLSPNPAGMRARSGGSRLRELAGAVVLIGAIELLGAARAGASGLVNVAGAVEGGIAVALFSQDTFDATLAIDGELGTDLQPRGWAYYGRLEAATIVFAFDGAYDVARVRLVTGHGMPDHQITAFQLWAYYPPDLAPEPPPEAGAPTSVSAAVITSAIRQREELESAAMRLRLEDTAAAADQGLVLLGAEFPFGPRGWTLVQSVRGSPSCAATLEQGVNGTIMAHGAAAALGDIELELPQTRRAMALKLVVRDANSPSKNAVLSEFQAFAARGQGRSAGSGQGGGAAAVPTVATAAAQASGVVFEDGPLNIRILSPEDGATMRQASLCVAVSGAPLGTLGVRIEV